MKNSIITRVIILGAIAIIGIMAVQSYWVISTWNINEEEFNKKVNLALYNVARALADINESKLPPRNIVNQRTANYYVVNIEDEIDANLLEFFLLKEFEALALKVDFEYAVFDCTTDEMVYGNFISFSPSDKRTDIELGNLPAYENFTYYFGVKFPDRSGYLLGKMQLSIFFSFILLTTVLFFAYSMFVILRQKRLSEMQKDFINNMTHEFKTPLSTIRISAEVLLSSPLVQGDRRLRQYATIVDEQYQRLNQQVEKVLQIARIEKGRFDIKPEKVVLKELLARVLESARVNLERQGGKLEVDLQAADVEIRADPLHLANVFHNLFDNALKYCRRAPLIEVSAVRSRHQLRVSVRDNGIGIDREYQPRVFDKFYRVPTGNVHNVKGFGLGLFYVRKICEAHGWKIRLESEVDSGTTVSILFPLK